MTSSLQRPRLFRAMINGVVAGALPLVAALVIPIPAQALLISPEDQSWDIGTVAGSWVEPPPQPKTNNLLPESETAATLRDQQWWGSSDLAYAYASAYLRSGEATTALFAFSVNPSATGNSAFVSAWQVQNGQLVLTQVNTLSSPGSDWAVVTGSGGTYASSSTATTTSSSTTSSSTTSLTTSSSSTTSSSTSTSSSQTSSSTELARAASTSGGADVPGPLPLLGAGFAMWWLWRPSRRMSRG